jgi:hypothetical protein
MAEAVEGGSSTMHLSRRVPWKIDVGFPGNGTTVVVPFCNHYARGVARIRTKSELNFRHMHSLQMLKRIA